MASTDLDLRAALDTTQDRLKDGVGVIAERADEAREVVKTRLEEDPDVQRAVRKAKITGWSAFRCGISALLLLPRQVVRLIGSLSKMADRAADMGEDVAERSAEMRGRGRDFIEHLPTARQRRKDRIRLAAFTSLGVVVGVAVGWVIGRRADSVATYEDTLFLDDEPWNPVDIDGEVGPNGHPVADDEGEATVAADGEDDEGSDSTA